MKTTLINRDGTEIDLSGYVQPVTFRIERRMVLSDELQQGIDALMSDPKLQKHMLATVHLTTLRMTAYLFGGSEAWVQSQLTEEERAALAKNAEPVERLALPSPGDC